MRLPCALSTQSGSCFSLYVLTRSGSQRFEFIFTQLGDAQPALPAVLAAVLSAYEASRPCRELRIRGARPEDKTAWSTHPLSLRTHRLSEHCQAVQELIMCCHSRAAAAARAPVKLNTSSPSGHCTSPCTGAVLVDKELRLLPREAAISRFNGVWNLAADAGSLGVLYITSMRVVWQQCCCGV
jgi:hypothetical protein